MEEIVRALSPIELGLWFLDEGVPLNFVTIARVRGPFGEAHFKAALAALQQRHPHLREHIIDRRFVRSAGAIPLRLLDGDERAVVAEVDAEMARPFRAASDVLGRCVIVRHAADDWTALLTLHHAIGDGMSGVFAMRDFVLALDDAHAGRPSRLLPLEVDTAVDHRLPSSAGGLAAAAAFVGRTLWSTVRHGTTPLTVRRDDASVTVLQRRPRLIHRELDVPEASALAARARIEDTTVHGALSAAMILQLLEDAGVRSKRRVLFGTPVNVRKELAPAVGESVGFFVSMIGFDAPVAAGTPFWTVARMLRNDLTARLARGEAHTVVGMLPKMFSMIRGHRDPRPFALEWSKKVPTTSGLTNLGRLEIETQLGAFRIESCHFAANPSALGEFLGTATSLHGRIHWNFVWPDPLITEAHALALVDGTLQRLRAAITSDRAQKASAPAA